MARVIEIALIEGVEGKTRAQQIERLKEWKKHYLSQGADKIVIYEAGPGNLNGDWVFEIHHKSGASFGEAFDKYYQNPKSHDDAMEAWQKTPTLKFNSYGVAFEVEGL